MLIDLSIRNFGIVDSADLEFAPGFLCITGETGAGKSLVVNALAFLLGDRGQTEWIRSGAAACEVSGRFTWPQHRKCRKLTREFGADRDEPLLLRRDLAQSGRSRVWINDRPSTVGMLRQVGIYLCDLHGQHAHQWLLNPESHGEFLDAFVPVAARQGYRDAFAQWQRCLDARRQAEADLAAAQKHKEFWQFQLAELERVNPLPGEYEDLQEQRGQIRAATRLGDLYRLLEAELGLADDSILPRLSDLESRLRQVSEPTDRMQRWADALAQARELLADISTEVARDNMAATEPGAAVEVIEARLHALYNLKKKFNESIEEAIKQRDTIRSNLRRLADSEVELRPLREAEKSASSTLGALAEGLHGARETAVGKMIRALRKPLAELGLPGNPISVRLCRLDRDAWRQDGPDEVEFMLAANPGEEPKPLARIASGGELSRVMLALKSVLPGGDRVETLVFDEVDSGIGAETAAVVAERLQALARGRQVIVITHLHPIVARSEHHWLVEKKNVGGRQVPVIRPLDAEERVEALGRLIAGGNATPQARAAARSLVGKPRSD